MAIQISLVFIFVVLDSFKDSIVSHDSYKSWGYFFTQAAAWQPKKTLFQKYFPMFFDAWHLAKHLQYHVIALILAVSIGSVLAYPIAVFLMSICFIAFYK